MEESVLTKMTESMREEGFKSGHEIHVWKHDGQYILIDGPYKKMRLGKPWKQEDSMYYSSLCNTGRSKDVCHKRTG